MKTIEGDSRKFLYIGCFVNVLIFKYIQRKKTLKGKNVFSWKTQRNS